MNITRYLKIGAFFVVLGVGGTIYLIKAADGYSPVNTRTYEVLLDDAQGLSTNSNIYMAGVPVGKIESIGLEDSRALVKVALLKNVELRDGTRITKQASSLLGTAELALLPGDPAAPVMKPGVRLASAAGPGDYGNTMATFNALGTQLSELLLEFRKQQFDLITATLASVKSVSSKVDARSDAELDRVSRILEATASIAERLDRISRERETDLSTAMVETRAALENVRALTDGMRRGDGTVGKAMTDDELYRRLVEVAKRSEEAAISLDKVLKSADHLVQNADSVVGEAKDIVAKANGLGVEVDVNSTYLANSRIPTAVAELRLVPRSKDRYYSIGVAGAPFGISKTTTTDTTTGGATTTTTEKETSDGVRFNAQLAKTFGKLTVRGGMIESTAGLAADWRVLPFLEFTGESYDLAARSFPAMRGYVSIYPFFDPRAASPKNWIYFRGGFQQEANYGRQNFFVGGGVRFADDEVRGLVGLIPLASSK